MALDDDIAVLASAPLLGLLPAEALRLICFAAERRALASGETLFRMGERADGGYVVLSGRLRVEARGGEVAEAGPGAVLGRTALFLREARPASARAAVLSEVVRVSPTLMRRVLEEFPAAVEAVRDALAADLAALADGLARVRARLDAIGPPGERSGAPPGNPPGDPPA